MPLICAAILWILTRTEKLFFPYPGLRAADQRKSQIPTHRQLPAAFFERHLTSVYPARVRVQNVAPRIFLTALFHVAQKYHTDHGLVFAIVSAFGAYFLRFFGIETGLDLPKDRAVLLKEPD